MIRSPFSASTEDAGDAEIRRRYLALVRDFPPDRAPDRFREYRAAYEALSDERKRLEMKLLHTNEAALSRLTAGRPAGRFARVGTGDEADRGGPA